jgi:hypothetical protein
MKGGAANPYVVSPPDMSEGIEPPPLGSRSSGRPDALSLATLAQPFALDGNGADMVHPAPAASPGETLDLGSTQTTPTHLCDTLQQNAMPQPVLPFAVAAAQASQTPTPSRESPSFESSFASRMADVDSLSALSDLSPPPTLPVPRASRPLQLPSFDLLGIAAPHPDQIDRSRSFDVSNPFCSVGAGPSGLLPTQNPSRSLSWPGEVVCDRDTRPPPDHIHLSSSKAIKQYISTVTPPDDSGLMDWGEAPQNPSSSSPPPPPPNQSQPPPARPSTIPIPANMATAEQSASFVQPVGLVNPGASMGETHGWLEEILKLIGEYRMTCNVGEKNLPNL